MWVFRLEVPGGAEYHVYSSEVNYKVDWLGTNFLHGIGWRPETIAYVSVDDDAILWRHGFIRACELCALAPNKREPFCAALQSPRTGRIPRKPWI